ncbi:putative membrane protein [Halobiforma haloterrestris]|uniref:Putative membrane protein n=1 Tax=Natronobacterium haloterrestre TaxID=148448 RepID=A0A1I1GYC8_NATHA|nr:SHOCT domain-containing protein [Halobiforma haloterrestris]SFC16674.1 putative membrane protein [Halobiforma haloterrestris]
MTDSDPLLRTIVVVLLAVLAIPLVMMLVAMPFAGAMHAGSGTGMWSGGMGTTGWLWMSAVPLLLLLLLGYGAIRLLGGDGGDDGDAALEELRRAYARGDLTDEEYEKRRQRLEAESDEP